MAKGKDERHNPNRKVTKEALGNRYAEIPVGFDTQDYDSVPNNSELRYEPNDDIGPYDGHDYEDEDE